MIASGKELSDKLKAKMAEEVASFPEKYGRVPHLVVILVGDDPASVSYVTGKATAASVVGIKGTTLRKPDTITEDELLALIAELNADDTVDGILVQLPLPKHIDEDKVIAAISKNKDVDGFHPGNVAALWQGLDCVYPCTPLGVMRLFQEHGVELEGKRAVVVGRSTIVGLPMVKLLLDANATVTVAHSRTKNLAEIKAYKSIKDSSCLLRVYKILIYPSGIFYSFLYCAFGNFVKGNTVKLIKVKTENFCKMP